MSRDIQLKTPFDKIALSLSGGGYRAAAFHLGSMAYLHRARFGGRSLLSHVKIISTVSGGTITGVFYAYLVQQGKPFPEIYRELMRLLDEFDLLQSAMARLRVEGAGWPAYKRRNLINAFAAIYDAHFTQGATFRIFENMERSHLEEVVFNATEFSNGRLFRFQNGGWMGNGDYPLRGDEQGDIKLGDIIAASSCFPGGFEPIAFPDDFLHPEATALRQLKEDERFAAAIGLMDGGICDNQGIDSILRAERRNRPSQPETGTADAPAYYYDLVIISDVASPYMDGFQFTEPTAAPPSLLQHDGARLYQKAGRLYRRVSAGLLVIAAAALVALIASGGQNNWLLGAGAVALLFALLLLLALRWGRRQLQTTAAALWSDVQGKFAFYLEKLGILRLEEVALHQLREPLLDRVTSLRSLVFDVFLKQIRRLIYRNVYHSPEWRFRRISNLIYELSPAAFLDPRSLGKSRRYGPWPAGDDRDQAGLSEEQLMGKILGARIPAVAEEARQMGTTLWFTPKEQLHQTLEKLVATGQFTMCYNLIYYLNDLKAHGARSGYDDLPVEQRQALDALYDQLLADWARFREDPFFMLAAIE